MNDLHFDEATHTYTIGTRVIPNVTRVLSGLVDYSKIPPDTLELARQRGVAVHKMVELDAKGILDEPSLPEWMKPVLARWRQFVADTGFRGMASEHRVHHRQYGYAGTLDLAGFFGDQMVFIDIKRSLLAGPVIGMQLAAYQEAFESQCGDVESSLQAGSAKRYALRLNENGPYRLEPYPRKSDFTDFLTCLAYYRLKEQTQ